MDAKHSKTLSGGLVALFVGSIFATGFVAAQDIDPTTAPNTVLTPAKLWGATGMSCPSATTTGCYMTYAVSGPIQYNNSWDTTFTNLVGAVGETFTLKSGANGGTQGPAIDVLAATDLAHSGKVNITFPASAITATSSIVGKFNQVGTWALYRTPTGGASTHIGQIYVNATENLALTLSQSTFTYTRNQLVFRVTVTDKVSGAPQGGVTVDFTELRGSAFTRITNTDGVVDYTGPAVQAGVFKLTATRDIGGDTTPEFKGEATMTMTAASLVSTAVTTDVLRGFAGAVEFNFTFPGSVQSPFAAPGGTFSGVNALTGAAYLNITHPSGCWIQYNLTTASTSWARHNGSASTTFCSTSTVAPGSYPMVTRTIGSSKGNIKWEDTSSSGWASGTYAMSLWINEAATTWTDPAKNSEYTSRVTWSPGSPADVNVKATPSSLIIDSVSTRGVYPRSTTAGFEGLPSTPWMVELEITGAYKTQHPVGSKTGVAPYACVDLGGPLPDERECWDKFGLSNITLSGDFITIRDATGTVLAPTVMAKGGLQSNFAAGLFTISNLFPSKGAGEVKVSVNWKNQTTVKTITVGQGGQITADKAEVVVDTATPITFTLRGPNGGLDPYGAIELYRVTTTGCGAGPYAGFCTAAISTATRSLQGDNTAGRGLDGQYTFNLNEANLGSYIAFGKSGQIVGLSDRQNYTYMTFRVVPAHDLRSTVILNKDITATNATELRVNVTKANGDTYAAGATDPSFFLLSAQQTKDFLANGTLPAAVTPVTRNAKSGCSGSGCAANYSFSSGLLAAGTFSVYARSNDAGQSKHDNRDTMPTVTVHPVNLAFSPDAVVSSKDIQNNETITVTATDWQGLPISGWFTLDNAGTDASSAEANATCAAAANSFTSVVVGKSGDPCGSDEKIDKSFSVKIEKGTAKFNLTGRHVMRPILKGVSTSCPGLCFDFLPSSTSTVSVASPAADGAANAAGTIRVVTPNVEVSPTRIPVDTTTVVTVLVKDLKGTPLKDVSVAICGASIVGRCTGAVKTDVAGKAIVGARPLASGKLNLEVNGNPTDTFIDVFAGLGIVANPESPKIGDDVLVTVAQPGKTGEGDVAVTIKDAAGTTVKSGVTTIIGTMTWTPTAAGQFTIEAQKAGLESATATITVIEAPPPPPVKLAKFELSALTVDPRSVELGDPVAATVTVKNIGDAEGVATVKIKVNGVTFDTQTTSLAPGESETLGTTITASQVGDFRIEASVNGGNTVGPVTVTAARPAPTPTSPPPATPPPTTGPTPTTKPEDKPTIPGFEAVFALAAIGAALVVLNRRRK